MNAEVKVKTRILLGKHFISVFDEMGEPILSVEIPYNKWKHTTTKTKGYTNILIINQKG